MSNLASSGPLALALDGIVRLLANMVFFQTWTGTANPTDAGNYIFDGDIGAPVVSVAIAADVVTVTTREVHGFNVGQSVSLEGASIGPKGSIDVAGIKTIASVPTQTSFTFAQSLDDDEVSNLGDAMAMPARPFALVMTDNKSLDVQQIGTGGVSNMNGAIDILIEADVSEQYQNDSRNALTEARNAIGCLIQGISELADGDYLTITRVELAQDPMFISRPEQTDNTIRFERWSAMVRVYHGLE